MKPAIKSHFIIALISGTALSFSMKARADGPWGQALTAITGPNAGSVTSLINASNTNINAGGSVTISWRCINATIGELFIQTGTDHNTDISTQLQGFITTGPLSLTTTYQVNCAASTASSWVTNTVVVNVTPAIPAPSATTTDSAVNTSHNVDTFNTAIRTSIDTDEIKGTALKQGDGQAWSIEAADKVSDLGAGKAATAGAVYCAQGANANLTDPADAAAYYASCQQNFEAANKMKRSDSFKADQKILDGEAAKEALTNFEKNFGITQEDYLSSMLAKGGGMGNLADMLEGKVSPDKFSEAVEAANKVTPSEMAQAPIISTSEKAKPKVNMSLRDSLRASLSANEGQRTIASVSSMTSADTSTGPKMQLGHSSFEEAMGTSQTEEQELTLFDVIHRKYLEYQMALKRK